MGDTNFVLTINLKKPQYYSYTDWISNFYIAYTIFKDIQDVIQKKINSRKIVENNDNVINNFYLIIL